MNLGFTKNVGYATTANNGYKALLLINYFFKDKSNALQPSVGGKAVGQSGHLTKEKEIDL